MLYDSTARNACFIEGRPPADIDELLAWARSQLPDRPPWRLISARRKLSKILFEIEEETIEGPRRLIGKFGNPQRVAGLYRTLKSLRGAGFAPPARYTVPEPVAFVADRGFVLQEKVPGQQAAGLFIEGADQSSAAADSARWLLALHRCGLPAAVSKPDGQAVWKWLNDLVSVQPSESRRIRRIADAIFRELDVPAVSMVPCHGDFHPRNIFIAEGTRITGIDIDKFALREPETDVGWFLMQAAAFGFFEKRSFDCTGKARRIFIEHYEAESDRPIHPRRVALYMAMAFLKNLHFELVLLNTGRTEYAEPWLWAAEAAILEGRLHLER